MEKRSKGPTNVKECSPQREAGFYWSARDLEDVTKDQKFGWDFFYLSMVRRHLGEIWVRKRTNLGPDIYGNLSKCLALQVSLYMCLKLLSPQSRNLILIFVPVPSQALWALSTHLLDGKLLSANSVTSKVRIIQLVQAFYFFFHIKSLKVCYGKIFAPRSVFLGALINSIAPSLSSLKAFIGNFWKIMYSFQGSYEG